MKSLSDLYHFRTETITIGARSSIGPGFPLPDKAVRTPPDKCQYLGEPFWDEEEDRPATLLAPSGGCGSIAGKKPFSVFECLCPAIPGGECLPYYRPCEKDRLAYTGKPAICFGCKHR